MTTAKKQLTSSDWTYKPHIVFDAFFKPNTFGYHIRMGQTGTEDEHTIVSRAEPVSFCKHERGECVPESSMLNLSPDEAQSLMNSLWGTGLRPENMRDYIAALKSNIDDLRKEISFLTQPEAAINS